jgi:endonuclease/exonuclease/phosphatase family metal-dependent hydrolase
LTGDEKHRLRIASYNVHACVGRDSRFDPARIADVIELLDADFVALQEVEDRVFESRDVSRFLAARLDMHAYRGVTLRRKDADYGNLLLARREAEQVRLHDISVSGGEPRGCIEADFLVANRRLRLFATHLGLRAGERLAQVQQLTPSLLRDGADIRVLAGDINEWRPAARGLRALRRVLGHGSCQRTFPAGTPAFALDRIFAAPQQAVRQVKAIRTRASRVASDHLPLVCDLSLAGL